MYILESIEINDMWGKKQVVTNLNNDVNIFIGKNGTGKTTLINILQAVLVVDLSLLADLNFSSVRFKLKKGNSHKTISATKTQTDIYYGTVKYRIGNKTYDLPLLPRDLENRRRVHSRVIEEITLVKRLIGNLTNVSWLSVHRELFEEDDYRERFSSNNNNNKMSNHIDRRVINLMNRLTAYQLQLQSQYGELSSEFQKDVLISMLYDSNFDTFKSTSLDDYNLVELHDKLTKAYQTLGIKNINNRIDEHINKLKATIDVLKNNTNINIDDIISVSLYNRTKHIVNLSNRLDEGKKNIFSPIERYINIINKFADNNSFVFSIKNDGKISIQKENRAIELEALSSGEKQLLILLTELLLQKNKTFIFIADEPELSLHIEWQRQLLSAVRELNSNAQIIVATHSPEIAGKWKNNVIRMEAVLHG